MYYIYIYIYIYIHVSSRQRTHASPKDAERYAYILEHSIGKPQQQYVTLVFLRTRYEPIPLKIHQMGVQWKQGVVICMMLYTSLLYNAIPIQCTPLPLYMYIYIYRERGIYIYIYIERERGIYIYRERERCV